MAKPTTTTTTIYPTSYFPPQRTPSQQRLFHYATRIHRLLPPLSPSPPADPLSIAFVSLPATTAAAARPDESPPPADVLLHIGPLTPTHVNTGPALTEAQDRLNWLNAQPHNWKIVVCPHDDLCPGSTAASSSMCACALTDEKTTAEVLDWGRVLHLPNPTSTLVFPYLSSFPSSSLSSSPSPSFPSSSSSSSSSPSPSLSSSLPSSSPPPSSSTSTDKFQAQQSQELQDSASRPPRTLIIHNSIPTPSSQPSLESPPPRDISPGTVPPGTDVLLTHKPPRYWLDQNAVGGRVGSVGVSAEVYRVKPRLVVVCSGASGTGTGTGTGMSTRGGYGDVRRHGGGEGEGEEEVGEWGMFDACQRSWERFLGNDGVGWGELGRLGALVLWRRWGLCSRKRPVHLVDTGAAAAVGTSGDEKGAARKSGGREGAVVVSL